tara:strand:- start:1078 stop:2862 length:1785 start_codon:yes stop_codon:yes gene_type:complete
MAGYTRQSTYTDGDIIQAADSNDEFDQLLAAFVNTTGHKHNGTAGEGPVIGLIGDPGVATPLNKVVVDNTNNRVGLFVDAGGAGSTVEQLRFQDGVVVPVTNNDIDLGTSSLKFKDGYFAGSLTVDGNITLGGDITLGDSDSDSINIGAEINSHVIPNTDDTFDLGSSTKQWRNLYIDDTANIDSLVADTADINGGTIDGSTIATSDITVGSGKTLDVSSGTLTLADNQISGDKVEGGTIAATTITTLTSTAGDITTVNSTAVNATTIDTTNIEVTNVKAKDGTAAVTIANSTGIVTVASSVLTTTDINGGTIDGVTIGGASAGDITFANLSDGTITVTAFVDEDNMSSDSATLIPTQQSVKAYVDAQVTASDLDFQADSGGALSIDLDSETMTFTGGTGIDTSGSGNDVTFAIDSTVATLSGTQTLTNKTIDVDNNTLSNIEIDNFKASAIVIESEGIGSNDNDTSIPTSAAVKDYVDTQITAEDLDITTDSGTIAIDLDSETLTVAGGTGIDSSATGNSVSLAIDSTVATLTGTQTLTNKTLTAPTINGATITGSATAPTQSSGTNNTTLATTAFATTVAVDEATALAIALG